MGTDDSARPRHTNSLVAVVVVFFCLVGAFLQLQKGDTNNRTDTQSNTNGSSSNQKSSSLFRDTDTGAVQSLKPSYIKDTQKRVFRQDGNGLLLNIHMTGGQEMTMCHRYRQVLTAPPIGCMGIKGQGAQEWKQTEPSLANYLATKQVPWQHADTGKFIATLLPHYRFVMQNFGDSVNALPNENEYHVQANENGQRIPLSATNWEHPQLVSVLVMMDPMQRLVLGSDSIDKEFGPVATRTRDQWWAYAQQTKSKYNRHSHRTDNFWIHLLSEKRNPPCCTGATTDRIHLQAAKDLLERFTYLVDHACLNASLEAMAGELLSNGESLPADPQPAGPWPSPRDQIGHEDIYNFLVQQNQLDIELYEWVKQQAIVKC